MTHYYLNNTINEQIEKKKQNTREENKHQKFKHPDKHSKLYVLFHLLQIFLFLNCNYDNLVT